MLDQVKQAYVDGKIDAEKLEEDIGFVLSGGSFAGSYNSYITRQSEIDLDDYEPVVVDGATISYHRLRGGGPKWLKPS